jgi:hypothetical protein
MLPALLEGTAIGGALADQWRKKMNSPHRHGEQGENKSKRRPLIDANLRESDLRRK